MICIMYRMSPFNSCRDGYTRIVHIQEVCGLFQCTVSDQVGDNCLHQLGKVIHQGSVGDGGVLISGCACGWN